MSKRKAEEEYGCDDASIISASDSFRSIRTRTENSSSTNIHHHQVEYENIHSNEYILFEILSILDNQVGQYDINLRKSEISAFMNQYPETNYIKPLRYSNQVIEIPICSNSNNSTPEVVFNENFPFRRDFTSVRVNIDTFLNHSSNYRNFTKVIVNGCKIKIVPSSISINYTGGPGDLDNPGRFSVGCMIVGTKHDRCFYSTLTESVLESSNILLSQPHVWLFVINKLLNDSRYVNLRGPLTNLIFKHFVNIFQKIETCDIVCSIDENGKLSIFNILHNYYTR